MFKKIISIVSAAALGVCCLTGCSNEAAPEKEAKELKKITVAEVTHSVFYAPQYVAMSQGFFEEEGLEIDLVNAQGADKTMAALISGDADIGLMGPEASIYIYNQGEEDYAVNFAQLTQCDGSFLVSREKIDNFSYEDLKGKEVLGGRAGGVPLMTLEYVLKQNGVEIGEDKDKGQCNVRTDVQFAAMAGAFAAGEADFTTAFEPTATQLEKEGTGYIVTSIGKDSGKIPYTAYSTTKSYMKDNKEVLEKFTRALYKAQMWCKDATDKEIAEAIQPYFEDNSIDDLDKLKRLLTVIPTSYNTIDYTKIHEIKKFYPNIYEKIINRLDICWDPTEILINKCIQEGLIKKVNLNLMKSVLIGSIRILIEDDNLHKEKLDYKDTIRNIIDIMFDGLVIK